jgi:hypothetical protein
MQRTLKWILTEFWLSVNLYSTLPRLLFNYQALKESKQTSVSYGKSNLKKLICAYGHIDHCTSFNPLKNCFTPGKTTKLLSLWGHTVNRFIFTFEIVHVETKVMCVFIFNILFSKSKVEEYYTI